MTDTTLHDIFPTLCVNTFKPSQGESGRCKAICESKVSPPNSPFHPWEQDRCPPCPSPPPPPAHPPPPHLPSWWSWPWWWGPARPSRLLLPHALLHLPPTPYQSPHAILISTHFPAEISLEIVTDYSLDIEHKVWWELFSEYHLQGSYSCKFCIFWQAAAGHTTFKPAFSLLPHLQLKASPFQLLQLWHLKALLKHLRPRNSLSHLVSTQWGNWNKSMLGCGR